MRFRPHITLLSIVRAKTNLLLCQSQNLMAVLGLVLATADMNPEVATIGGFYDGLIKIDVFGSQENLSLRSSLQV